jgi:hypothetical protein
MSIDLNGFAKYLAAAVIVNAVSLHPYLAREATAELNDYGTFNTHFRDDLLYNNSPDGNIK